MSKRGDMIEEQKSIEQKWHSVLVDTPTKENIQQAYEELHSFYLRSRGYLYPVSTDITDKVILRLVGGGKNVLELGFGNGELSCWLGCQGNKVLGIDISAKAVESGRKMAADLKIEGRVGFQQGDVTNTGLPNGAYDFVISQWLIEHIHPSQVGVHLNEVRRILSPNGAYIFIAANKYDGATSLGMHLKEWGFTEMRRFVEQHGFVCYWLDTRMARFFKPVLIPPRMLWIPDLMENIYTRLGCKRIFRLFLRPNVFFLARKVN